MIRFLCHYSEEEKEVFASLPVDTVDRLTRLVSDLPPYDLYLPDPFHPWLTDVIDTHFMFPDCFLPLFFVAIPKAKGRRVARGLEVEAMRLARDFAEQKVWQQ